MGLMGWILIVVLLSGGTVVWLMLRYPGGWRYAFSAEYAENRRDLDAARGKLRQLEREAGREHDAARSEMEAADRDHRNRVGQARAHLAWLRAPAGARRDPPSEAACGSTTTCWR